MWIGALKNCLNKCLDLASTTLSTRPSGCIVFMFSRRMVRDSPLLLADWYFATTALLQNHYHRLPTIPMSFSLSESLDLEKDRFFLILIASFCSSECNVCKANFKFTRSNMKPPSSKWLAGSSCYVNCLLYCISYIIVSLQYFFSVEILRRPVFSNLNFYNDSFYQWVK